MSISSAAIALTSSTKTLLFSSDGDLVTGTQDGSPLRGIEVRNHSGSANDVIVYIAPIDGAELTSGDSWPTNADATNKGATVEAGQSRQVIAIAAATGRITQVWVRSAGATVSFGPTA